FEHPWARVVRTELRVERPFSQLQRPRCAPGAFEDVLPDLSRQARWSNVDRFLEVRPFEGIRLIKQGQHAKLAAVEEALERDFLTLNVALDEQLVERRLARHLDLWRFEQGPNAPDGTVEFERVIRTDHSLAGRKRERLHDARKLDARKNRIERFAEAEGEKLRHRKPRGAQDFALAELVAASLDRFGRVRNQAQGLRGISGRLGRAIA